MPFVKLDCEILESSLWDWTPERHIFITALLMARPKKISQPMEQIEVESLEKTGFVVPPGQYGFVNASGTMLVKKALSLSPTQTISTGDKRDDDDDFKTGLAALRMLGEPDVDSRSQDFEGRRLIRVDGGYIVLNYNRYRDKDHTSTERKRRLRAKAKEQEVAEEERPVPAGTTGMSRHVPQADAEAEADQESARPPAGLDEEINALCKIYGREKHQWQSHEYAMLKRAVKAGMITIPTLRTVAKYFNRLKRDGREKYIPKMVNFLGEPMETIDKARNEVGVEKPKPAPPPGATSAHEPPPGVDFPEGLNLTKAVAESLGRPIPKT